MQVYFCFTHDKAHQKKEERAFLEVLPVKLQGKKG
jgi:hypothetical protein